MTIDNEDFKAFFDVAFNVTNINELKCFECAKAIKEEEDLSGLTCENNHKIGYLEYMTAYASMLNDIAENAEFTTAFQKKVIQPSTVIYVKNQIVFSDKSIIRK